MARGKGTVNKVMLIGYCGADPEMRSLPSGDPLANLRVATTEAWRDRDNAAQERTEWHRVTLFGKLAEIAGNWLRKGSLVYLEGSLRTRKWTGQDGVDRYTTEIIADSMTMLGGRNAAMPSENAEGMTARPAPPVAPPAAPPAAPKPMPAAPQSTSGSDASDFSDDDIPF